MGRQHLRNEDSDSLLSSESSSNRRRHNKKKKKKKKKNHRKHTQDDDYREEKKERKRQESSDENDNSSYDGHRRSRKKHASSDKKKKAKEKRKKSRDETTKKSKKRKRYSDNNDDDEYSSYSSSDEDGRYSSSEDDEYSSSSSRHHRKRRRRKERKRHKKRDGRKQSRKDDNDKQNQQRNYELADALLALLDTHPAMVADLPIILIRLASGTTFDLTHMQPASAARALRDVLQALTPFGVVCRDDGAVWAWTSPTGQAAHTNQNQVVLVRVVRAMLDQMGLTLEAIDTYENPTVATTTTSVAAASDGTATLKEPPVQQDDTTTIEHSSIISLKDHVQRILDSFPPQLATEMKALCQMILDGESVSLEGLPDETLRTALHGLLADHCGLVQAEMEVDDDDEGEEEPSLGFTIPQDANSAAHARAQLTRICEICQTVAARPARVQGPKRPPTHYSVPAAAAYAQDDDDDEDIGPSMTPRATPATDKMSIEAQAARRQQELSHVAAGQGPLPADSNQGGREEWMTTPGKSDFFDFIKTGQPLKGRKFQGKTKGANNDDDDAMVDPAVKAEMDAIMQAHSDARGPSLMEEHQAAQKAAKEAEKSTTSGKQPWKWSRNQDLDAGRRVDKDALQMVFGGAASGLKSKFQGGFSGAR